MDRDIGLECYRCFDWRNIIQRRMGVECAGNMCSKFRQSLEIEKKAKSGNAAAQYKIAEESGSFKWYRKAAEQGHPQAQYELGYYYSVGWPLVFMSKNMTEAVNWWRKAAERGHAKAQYELGRCYSNGNGVEKDMTEAVKWYQKAAEQGHKGAKKALQKLQS